MYVDISRLSRLDIPPHLTHGSLLLVVSGLVTLGASPALPTTPHLHHPLIIWPPVTCHLSPGAVALPAVDVPVLAAAEAGGGELGGAGGAGEALAVVQLARARHHLAPGATQVTCCRWCTWSTLNTLSPHLAHPGSWTPARTPALAPYRWLARLQNCLG